MHFLHLNLRETGNLPNKRASQRGEALDFHKRRAPMHFYPLGFCLEEPRFVDQKPKAHLVTWWFAEHCHALRKEERPAPSFH